MKEAVSSKQELLDRMADRADGSKVIQQEGTVLGYNGAEDRFYFAPTKMATPVPIDDEDAIRIYNEYFVSEDTADTPSLNSGDVVTEGPLVYETDIVEYMDLSAVSIEDYTFEIVSSPEFEAEYSRMLHAIDTLNAIKKKVDSRVKELMKEKYLMEGQNKIEGEILSMTLIPESYRETFDISSFRRAYPELYEQFKKVTKVNESLRINRKERKR